MKFGLKYIKALDGLRAIAALMIICFHYFRDTESDNYFFVLLAKFCTFGQTGVSLFFVLSGFLVTRVLLSTKPESGYFKKFYIRRILRIFPLYYLFLILWYVLVPFFNDSDFFSFNDQIYYWIYLQDFAITFGWKSHGPDHFWSLSVEEHLYLIWPLMIYFLSTKTLSKCIWFFVALALLVRLLLVNHNYPTSYFTFSRLDDFSLGALLALWELNGKLKTIHANKFLIYIMSLLIPTVVLWGFVGGDHADWLQVVKFSLLAFIYFFLIGFVVTAGENHWFNRFLNWKFFNFTGKISYGLYVYHPLCFLIAKQYVGNSPLLLFAVGMISSYLISYLSYTLFESKFIHLKKYFEYKAVSEDQVQDKNAVDMPS